MLSQRFSDTFSLRDSWLDLCNCCYFFSCRISRNQHALCLLNTNGLGSHDEPWMIIDEPWQTNPHHPTSHIHTLSMNFHTLKYLNHLEHVISKKNLNSLNISKHFRSSQSKEAMKSHACALAVPACSVCSTSLVLAASCGEHWTNLDNIGQRMLENNTCLKHFENFWNRRKIKKISKNDKKMQHCLAKSKHFQPDGSLRQPWLLKVCFLSFEFQWPSRHWQNNTKHFQTHFCWMF